jgi:hypothetical protein
MGIKLFEHANFQGDSVYLGEGQYDLDEQSPNLEGEVSSYILDGFTKVSFSNYDLDPLIRIGARTYFSDENYSQDPKEVAYVGDTWNDTFESIVVERIDVGFGQPSAPLDVDPNIKGVTVFVDWKFNQDSPRFRPFESRSQTFAVGEFNLPFNEPIDWIGGRRFFRPGIQPFSISSIKVGKGFYVELFDQSNFLGDPLIIVESCQDIRLLNPNRYKSAEVQRAKSWNDRTVSLRVKEIPGPR